ncbi:TonB-dependent receptor [Lewinella sp. JB7]|uniref:SusC/RagA family TonB-linked outer membrane protein n=1 Tax=Lewinella sp. JB7 TaxID=2962887 RepID=UPI0020C9AE5F|nr:TonB-dependent receptor [Lewinella sp. JB7]MCP9234838.1 TonB-dependent receptor [Lewinella sp. JB7]
MRILLPRGAAAYLMVVACTLFANLLSAQITGTVVDADTGDPLIGASILIKGTTSGVVTDLDGAYSIDAEPSSVLVISYTGYQTQEVLVGDASVVDVTMTSGELLEEVVVTGYTAQSKRDITGAVATVDSEELLAVPATTFAQQLQGRASGITVVNDATPGGEATIRIRGYGTVGNNSPLYVIDGVPTRNQNNLNPNDIESLQVLKDASAASIYGSRAANGVVIITTKKGKLGKPTISYNTYYGLQNAAQDVDVLNAEELGRYLYLADLYAGKDPSHGQYDFGPNGEVSIPNYVFPSGAETANEAEYSLTPENINAITRSADTDWWDEVTRSNAPIQNHQVSATGATEFARYAFSLNYFDQEAITRFVSYERMSLRANTQFSAIGDRLRIGENFTMSFGNRKGGFSNNSEQNAVSGSYKHHPLLPVYDIAGNFAGSRGANLGNNFNPYAVLARDQDDRSYNLRAFGNVYAELDIIDDLTFKTSFGLDANTNRNRNIGRPQPEYVEGNFINSLGIGESYEYEWVWTNTVSYARELSSDHQISGLAGVEAISGFGEFSNASRQRFPSEDNSIISYLNLGDLTTASNSGGTFKDFSLFGVFAQANYAFRDRYLVQVIGRYDQSSRFLTADNAAFFPSVSLGWRVSDEPFFAGLSGVFSDLKLRYGWGQTGNQEIGDYNSFTTYRSNIFNAGYPIDGSTGSPVIGFDAASFGNPLAQWETTTSNNLGFDAAMFNNRLDVELDLWNRTTTDVLLQVPITFSAGDASPPAFNVGEVSNKGVDLGLNWNGGTGSFYYSIGGNFSTYRNEVVALNDPDARIFGFGSRVPSMTVTQAGQPISSFFGFKTDGIFQSQAEADAHPAYGSYNAPGKFRFVDVNEDGVISDADRTIIGNPHPDFTYGVNLTLGYGNFELNIFGNGSQGNDIFNYTRFFADFNTFQGNRSKRALYDAWQPTNPTAPREQWVAANPGATSPIMDANDQISSQVSDYLIEDGSFFRIRNIQLTYSLPTDLGSRLGLSNAQVYIQGQNMITITKYNGLNPEIQSNTDTTLGFDGGYMPVSRTLLFGLNVSFQ